MKKEQIHVLKSRQFEVLKSLNNSSLLIDILVSCNLIDLNVPLKSVIDSLINAHYNNINSKIYEIFCFSLASSGNFEALTKLIDYVENSNLNFTFTGYISDFFDPMKLSIIQDSPSMPARLCLRKFRNQENSYMSSKRQHILNELKNLFESQLNIDPLLIYFHFYKVFDDDTLKNIKIDSFNKTERFLSCLTISPDYAFERLCHALILSQQWKLFTIINGYNIIDIKLLEEMSLIHLEFIKAIKHDDILTSNLKLSCLNNLSITSDEDLLVNFGGNSEDDDEILQIREPDGYLEFEVDVCDSGTYEDIINKGDCYRNFSSPKGYALIINNSSFDDERFPSRDGTDVDESNIKKLLEKLGYRVNDICRNITARKFIECAKKFVNNPNQRCVDSCIVVVMTHGEYESFIGTDGNPISVHDFISCFNANNAPLLSGKPKIFMFQACRGNNYDYGAYHRNHDSTDVSLFSCIGIGIKSNSVNEKLPELENIKEISQREVQNIQPSFPIATSRFQSRFRQQKRVPKIPSEGDMLIAYATTPKYVSWRNRLAGSWFIQSICEIFSKNAAKMDIIQMFTRVNARVAEEYESSGSKNKQTPEIHHRLRKEFYFFPGITKTTTEPKSTAV